MSYFETELIHHAAPTLLGRKQANLFSFPLDLFAQYKDEIDDYQRQLAPHGIQIVYLYSCQKRVCIMVYREKALLRGLRIPHVKKYLVSIGYPETLGSRHALAETIRYLRSRMRTHCEFPHEIGFFLGYPPADVFSFIQKKGQHYKCIGYWKVYGDEAKALRIFQCYEDCRETLMQQVAAGTPILSLLGIAC